MRLATYRLKGDSAVELSVSEAGGDVDSNVSRWRGQFGNAVPEIAESQRSGLTITEVKLRGTYVGMGNTPAGENYAMRVAIVSQPNAPSHLFFKMVGPADAVQGANALFDQLVASLAPSP